MSRRGSVGTSPDAAAFYARPSLLRRRWLGDWWTLLHPPYTLWHLAYVTIGGCLVGPVSVSRLVATLLAFFLAVGIGAHALDELRGRPLGTAIPRWQLVAAAAGGLVGATALGIVGVVVVGPVLIAFIVVGLVLAIGYNLELWGGRLHHDAVFALAWGAFPVLTAFAAQHGTLDAAAVLAATFAAGTAATQRRLSTPARQLRRRTASVHGEVVALDGTSSPLDAATMLAPLEHALQAMSLAMVALGAALAVARLHP
jgi:hypothetical protein